MLASTSKTRQTKEDKKNELQLALQRARETYEQEVERIKRKYAEEVDDEEEPEDFSETPEKEVQNDKFIQPESPSGQRNGNEKEEFRRKLAVKQNGEVNLLGLAINTVYNIETGLATPYTQAKSKISALLRRSDRIDVDDLTAQAALHHKSPKETHYLYLAGAAIMHNHACDRRTPMEKTRTVIHEFANQTATVNFSTEAVQSRGPIMVQMPSGRSYNLVDLFAEPMAIRTFGKTPEKAVSLIVLDILRKINVTEPSYRSYSTSSSTKQFIYVGDSLLEGLAMLCFRGISFPEKSRDADEMRLRKHILDVLRNKYERIRSDNMERMRQGKSVDSPLLENVQDDSLCLNTPKMEYMNDDLWPEENFCSNAQSWSTEDCERYGNFSNDCSRKREVSSPSEMTEIKRAYSEEPENQLNS